MQTLPKLKKLMTGVAPFALAATLLPSPVFAQAAAAGTQSPPTPADSAAPSPSADETSTIVVTGSLIRRTNSETASPVDVLTNTAIETAGYDTLSSALTNLTANGAGTLSANNSVAFAGGASGIALRGLSVGATLTLVDGHRLAPYPLSDDGERQFTDVQSIPLGAIDSIEVDKDGASSIYGSDAIAGVVNIKLKKQITGVEASGELGTSQHGGGFSKRYDFSAGYGDLSTDGYNAFITIEYRTQDEIDLTQRQYQPWASENFTSIGGNDLRPGSTGFAILNGGYALTQTPFLVTPSGQQIFLGSGCNSASYAANQCAYVQKQQLLAPTQKFSALAGFTKDFAGGWEAKLKLSFFDSQGQQVDGGPVIFGPNSYPGASFGGNPGLPLGLPGVGAIASYTLPANYLGTGSPAGSFLEGVIPGLGLPTNKIESKTYRAALDVTGKIGTWDITGSLGYSRVNTRTTFVDYVNYDTLYNDLTTFNAAGQPLFNPTGGNSYAELNNVAPTLGFTASDTLYYAEADGTGKLLDLPGGDLSMAVGATVIQKNLNNPGQPTLLAGIGGNFADNTQPFQTYAIGKETNVAEFIELEANIWHTVNINASARDDWYNTYGNSITPKVGLKWTPVRQFVLRGTFSKGFRAPAPAEFGNSKTVFSLGAAADPVLCPNGAGGPFPAGTVPASCSSSPGYVQTTSSGLKPETSTNFTGGAVFEPVRGLSATIDYYHIQIKNQIISQGELPTYFSPASVAANCLRGPDLPITGVSNGDGGTYSSPTAPLTGPIVSCGVGYVNAQSTTTSGLDFQAQFHHSLGSAKLSASFEWTHEFEYNLTSPTGVTFHLAGTHGPSGVSGDTGNPRDHFTASLTFEEGPFDLTLSGYRIGSFSVTDPSAGNGGQSTCAGAWGAAFALAGATPGPSNSQYCKVAAFTSVNLVTSYKFTPYVKLTFSVDNLFDANAPLDAETYSGLFTPVNPSLDEDGIIGRFFRVGVNFKY